MMANCVESPGPGKMPNEFDEPPSVSLDDPDIELLIGLFKNQKTKIKLAESKQYFHPRLSL